MPLDALTLGVIVSELDAALRGGKINKITQPAADTVVFNVYNNRQDFRLVLAADPASPKLFLTHGEYVNPSVAPSFCMHLRKHILNSEIIKISSPKHERLVKFDLLASTEFSSQSKTLIYEMMGRYSNIFLLSDNGIISDCLKKIPPDKMEAARNTLAGLPYIEPPLPPEILPGIRGISRAAAEEVTACAKKNETTPEIELDKMRGEYAPVVYMSGGLPVDFTFTPYSSIAGEQMRFPSMLEAMRFFYTETEAAKAKTTKSSHLLSVINKERAKVERTRKTLETRLLDCQSTEQNKIYGDLLTANIYKIKPRDEFVEVQNYFSETGEIIKIALDRSLSPPQNAQRYYKKYTKQKKTFTATQEQLLENEERLKYLDSIKYSVTAAENISGFEEIEAELISVKLIPPPARTGGKQKKAEAAKTPNILTFEHGGFKIYAGKNNIQNEYVTFRIASDNDLWLHVQGAPGAHVVVKMPATYVADGLSAIPDDVLLFAARTAVENSSLKGGAKTAVDYVFKKHIKKSRAGTGLVHYTDYKTIII